MIIASKAQRRKQGSRAHKHQSAQKLERERERENLTPWFYNRKKGGRG